MIDLEIWLRDWRIANNVGNRVVVLFTTRRIPPPRPLKFLGEEIRSEEKVIFFIGDLPGLVLYIILDEKHPTDSV